MKNHFRDGENVLTLITFSHSKFETFGHIYTGANFAISFSLEGFSWKHLMKGDKFPS